jgi:phospholipase C
LPYELHTSARVNSDALSLSPIFRNSGSAGAVFHVYDLQRLDRIPRRYTVEASKQISADWGLQIDAGIYDLAVYGPNGFFRSVKGTGGTKAQPDVAVHYETRRSHLRFVICNPATTFVKVKIAARAYRTDGPWNMTIKPKGIVQQRWSLRGSGGWYDFAVNLLASPDYERRVARRVKNDKPSHSDPANRIGCITVWHK